jgi:hypothetical protein
MQEQAPITVAVTNEFLSMTRKMLDDEERDALIDFLAYHPEAGDVIAGTGGVRKVRWRLEGRGKRGGARVIYYYLDHRIPLTLLSAYAKNEQSDLSMADRRSFRDLKSILLAAYGVKDR